MSDFIAFHINGLNHFLYMLTSNAWFLLLLTWVTGTIILRVKEEMDESVREEQNMI